VFSISYAVSLAVDDVHVICILFYTMSSHYKWTHVVAVIVAASPVVVHVLSTVIMIPDLYTVQ